MKIIDDIKRKNQEYNSWQNRYERLKASEYNKKARQQFEKSLLSSAEQTFTEEQEAVLFSQSYQKLMLKNPAAAKFPEFDEYEVNKTEYSYIVKGYNDCTNSYGAQVREKYELEVLKKDGEWTCITDNTFKYLKWILIWGILIALPLIIAYCSMPSF